MLAQHHFSSQSNTATRDGWQGFGPQINFCSTVNLCVGGKFSWEKVNDLYFKKVFDTIVEE